MKLKNIGIEGIVGLGLVIFLTTFPLYASDFRIELMNKFIGFIIFAIALDLIWGYTGLLSLGNAVFFGIGGYMLALSYTFQNGVPNFMSRFDINEIPVFMKPLESTPIAFALGLILPALVAAIIGFFIFKGKVSGVYFAIITLALAKLFELVVTDFQVYTGGFNGLMGLPHFPIFGQEMSIYSYYYFVLLITIAVYLFARWLTRSHFGKVIKAIRENESRISFLSYNTPNFKIIIFTISGFLSGLAGMLYVPVNGFFSPQDVGVGMSTILVVWLAIGGRGTLMGAAIGSLTVNWLSNLISEQFPTFWQLFIGSIIVLVVLFLPDGIYGSLQKWWDNRAIKNHSKNNKKTFISLLEKVKKVT